MIVRVGKATDNHHASTLSLPAVLGNLFSSMFTGREADANTILFAMLLLACHPSVQKPLQQDIDKTVSLHFAQLVLRKSLSYLRH